MMIKTDYYPKAGILACFLLLFAAGSLNGQTVSKASYDKTSKVIVLDAKAPFGYLYQLDLAPMKFSSKEKADEFFGAWTTELVSYQVNFDQKKADILLKTRSKPDWRAKEWNAYLAQFPKQ